MVKVLQLWTVLSLSLIVAMHHRNCNSFKFWCQWYVLFSGPGMFCGQWHYCIQFVLLMFTILYNLEISWNSSPVIVIDHRVVLPPACCPSVSLLVGSPTFSIHFLAEVAHVEMKLIYRFIITISSSSLILVTIEPFLTELCPLNEVNFLYRGFQGRGA